MAPTFSTSDFDGIELLDSLGNRIELDFEIQIPEDATFSPDEIAGLVESIALRVESGEREGKLFAADGVEVGWFSSN